MSDFFIKRPILAWVLAISIALIGAMSIPRLPLARYPNIAPPTVYVTAAYPGASARTVEDSVTQVIEQFMTNLDGLISVNSTSDNTGNATIELAFTSATDPDTAQVQVQNKLQLATPLLPQLVQQQGVTVTKVVSGGNLLVVAFTSADGSLSESELGDYVASKVLDPVSRVPGVGAVQLMGSKYAMRIWLDADKLNTYGLTPADITAAVQAQNAQLSVGQLGDTPSPPGQQLNATVTAMGRLETPEQFRDIVLRSNGGGSVLRLGDVARVELGQADYTTVVRYNGKPAAGIGVKLANGANALTTAQGVKDLIRKMTPQLPAGMQAIVPYDPTPFISKSIAKVVTTLLEAIVLVFLVMFLFLQSFRATLIPTIAVPVVVLGTFAVLSVAGLSINLPTMFAIVLAIGLLVDDAIVVVENVERLMREEGLSPVEATRRSMRQITGALVGISTVLSAVFVPMAFLEGASGVLYRQFAITIVTAMVLSALTAIVLTPALCATLLKPARNGEQRSENAFFRWFNARFDGASARYQRLLAHILGRPARYLAIYGALVAVMGVLFFRMPTAFLPSEDERYLFAMVQGPVGATQGRTLRTLDQVRKVFLEQEKDAVVSIFSMAGFSFSGNGQNTGFNFVQLKDWSERKDPRLAVRAVQGRANAALSEITDAEAFAIAPPPAIGLGRAAGFDFYLKDDHGQGHAALTAAHDRFLELAAKDELLANVRSNGQEDAPQFHLDVDVPKVTALGVSMSDINDTLAVAWAGRYIDDFIDRGKLKRVIVQADAPFRMAPEDFSRWHVRNQQGDMVSVGSFANYRWEYGPPQVQRYNGFSAMNINGEAAPGVSSGDAMRRVEELVRQLGPGYSVDFAGQSYQERLARLQTPMLYALTLIFVFLCLAALYESWSIPTVILLAVPLGVIGAVVATSLRGLPRDVYFEVAMLATIGLVSKNTILIVEFAKQYVQQGMPLVAATLRALRDRVRPILMTSLAFGLGVAPLVVATGASAGAQRSIGTGVFGGMLAGTFLGCLFIPLLFVAIQRLFHGARAAVPGAREPLSTVQAEGAAHGA